MKIIISPAKKMQVDTEIEKYNMPCFLDKTELLMKYIQNLDYEEAKILWKCSDKIAKTSFEYFTNMNLTEKLTPAILAYEGIQYQYISPNVFDLDQLDYIENHLYILSGFYGILKPFDGVVPYRLEMQAPIKLSGYKDLYDYWGNSLFKKLYENTNIVLNLASKEYSKCIENYLNEKVQLISCTFGEYKEGKILTKGTLAKMARGEMVRFMAEEKIETISEIKNFNRLGYKFNNEKSNNKNIVFIKE
ncbi:peroxide stress protein YaaA [Clostridium saccharoperbutylacetonicum]|uniref:peroxide stress protein YaaA n=1 Tax=Clostridium saccharoperbutylacetonicum TaxID=36745 RepID=UPI0039EA1631